MLKSCVYLRFIQCHLIDMTLDAPKTNVTSEGKFGTLSYKDKVCSFSLLFMRPSSNEDQHCSAKKQLGNLKIPPVPKNPFSSQTPFKPSA